MVELALLMKFVSVLTPGASQDGKFAIGIFFFLAVAAFDGCNCDTVASYCHQFLFEQSTPLIYLRRLVIRAKHDPSLGSSYKSSLQC